MESEITMGIKLNNRQALELLSAISLLDKLNDKGELIYNVPPKARYALSKRLTALRENSEVLDDLRKKLVKEHGLEGKENQKITPEIQVQLDAFNAAWEEVMDEEAVELGEIKHEHLKFDELDIPVNAMTALGVIVVGAPEL